MAEQFRAACASLSATCGALPEIGDAAVELALLRLSTNVCRVDHLLRAAGPAVLLADLDGVDEVVEIMQVRILPESNSHNTCSYQFILSCAQYMVVTVHLIICPCRCITDGGHNPDLTYTRETQPCLSASFHISMGRRRMLSSHIRLAKLNTLDPLLLVLFSNHIAHIMSHFGICR